MEYEDLSLMSVARGETPADLVFRGGRVVNVFSGELEEVDVALAGPWIAALGPGYEAKTTIDLDGSFLLRVSSTPTSMSSPAMTTPREFARAVVPGGPPP